MIDVGGRQNGDFRDMHVLMPGPWDYVMLQAKGIEVASGLEGAD